MIDCDFQIEGKHWTCQTCHWKYSRKSDKPPRRNCPKGKLEPEVAEAGKQLGWKPEHATRYLRALIRWIAAGRPTRDDEEVTEAVAICEACNHYRATKGRCGVCGCAIHTPGMVILSKARLATERCPKDKW